MNGYEHDLGREKTNLDVFYTILNFFFASDAYFKKSPQNYHKSGFPYSLSCVIQIIERPKKGQYRMSNQMPLFGFFAIYGFKAKNKFRIG